MKILNFGSLNIDHVYQVEHFVRPGETVSADGMHDFVGGKGLNQSVAAARGGAQVYHAGCVGKDGSSLTQTLREAGVDISCVRQSGVMTGNAVIQVDSTGQNSIIVYGGANRDIGTEFVDEVLRRFSRGDILLLQNEISRIPYIMRQAHQKGMKIYLNPSPITADLLKYPLELVSCFILNEDEGSRLTGRQGEEEIAGELLKKYPRCRVLLTLGGRGALYRSGTAEYRHGTYPVKPVDTTGAGDTFTGYFLAGTAAGKSVEESLRLASIAASIAVTRNGASASIPTLREVCDSGIFSGL